MRGKGINYDTGFSPAGENSRPDFDADVVGQEMQIIAEDLRCTAVRITGGEPERLSVAAEHAAAAGLEVWFSPFPCELTIEQLRPFLSECAERAEQVRSSGAPVVFVTGCELTLFSAGFLPGASTFERIANLQSGSPELYAAFGKLPGKLNGFLAEAARDARRRFGGPISYASGMWEPVNWAAFDIAATDAYRDAGNAGRFRDELRARRAAGKPLVVTEFGCCAYTGAADRGGMGWAILDESSDPPRLNGEYTRDEAEQVRYLAEMWPVFEAEQVDLAFWFTFAGYQLTHEAAPQSDLDMASYGVVKMLVGGPGSGYQGLGWEPKLAFETLASLPVGAEVRRD